jgi:23S rRNA (adenine1618-N6)-methyltransferase
VSFHPRNIHSLPYDFDNLVKANPDLVIYIIEKENGEKSINFKKAKQIKALSKALIKKDYQIDAWDFPDIFQCPPIPTRADYIHHLADLLADLHKEKEIPKGNQITVLNVGSGASCIFPLLAHRSYDWHVIASEADEKAFTSAGQILDNNPKLKKDIEMRHQANSENFFKGICKDDESYELCICHPPFNDSIKNPEISVKNPDLSYPGGELNFISKMIQESKEFQYRFLYFTTMVAKKDHLKKLTSLLKKEGAKHQQIIEIGTGNKVSRILVWSFLSRVEMRDWRNSLW